GPSASVACPHLLRRSKMVALTRKVGERLLIGGAVVVEVLDVWAGRVRFGVQAPKGVTVLREVLDVPAGRVRFGEEAPDEDCQDPQYAQPSPAPRRSSAAVCHANRLALRRAVEAHRSRSANTERR